MVLFEYQRGHYWVIRTDRPDILVVRGHHDTSVRADYRFLYGMQNLAVDEARFEGWLVMDEMLSVFDTMGVTRTVTLRDTGVTVGGLYRFITRNPLVTRFQDYTYQSPVTICASEGESLIVTLTRLLGTNLTLDVSSAVFVYLENHVTI